MLDGKTLFEAVKASRAQVADKAPRSAKRTRPNLSDPMVKELYFSVIN